MRDLIEYVVKALVDHPEQVSVTEITTGTDVILELHVAPDDMGRVIGRNGRVINALRTLAQICAARQAKRAEVEVMEAA